MFFTDPGLFISCSYVICWSCFSNKCVCDGVFSQDERRMLLNKRLDLDIARARLKRAHEAEREATVSFIPIL